MDSGTVRKRANVPPMYELKTESKNIQKGDTYVTVSF